MTTSPMKSGPVGPGHQRPGGVGHETASATCHGPGETSPIRLGSSIERAPFRLMCPTRSPNTTDSAKDLPTRQRDRQYCRLFCWSFRQSRHHLTQPHGLDDPPDLRSEDRTLPDGMTAVGRPPIPRLQFESRRGAPNPSTSSQFHSRRPALALDRAVDPESAACRPARGHAGDRVLFDDRAGKPGRAINGRREPPGAHVGGQLVSLGGDNQLRPGWSSTEAWSWTGLG